jgi:hypothetical protein
VQLRAEHRNSRRIALLAVVALHLLGGLLIGSAFRTSRTPVPDDPAMVWIGWPDPAAAKAPRPRALPLRAQPPRAPLLSPQPRVAPAGTQVAPITVSPAVTGSARPTTNWRLEAQRAAGTLIARSDSDRHRDGLMGSIPRSPFGTRSPRPAFPWSRQPLSKHFDADPHTGMISLSGKRCTLAFFLILPGFGCALGPLDPEPGRGDLFDPKYKLQPLELPDSLATMH